MAALASVVAGASTTLLIATINGTLRSQQGPNWFVFLGLCLTMFVMEMVSRVLLIRLSQRCLFQMRTHLSEQLLAAPLSKLEEVGPNHVFYLLGSSINEILTAIMNFPAVLTHAAVILGGLVYVFVLWPPAGFVIVVTGVGAVTISRRLHRRGLRDLFSHSHQEQEVFNLFRGMVDGAKELKLHRARRDEFRDLLANVMNALRLGQTRSMSILATSQAWGGSFVFFMLGFGLYALPKVSDTGWGVLGGYVLACLFLAPSTGIVLNGLSMITRAGLAIQKLENLGLSLPRESASNGEALIAPWKKIDLAQVTYTYGLKGESAFTLGPLELSLNRGEVLFLIGGNGSGKSTLAKLLTGLYVPSSGVLRVDGKPILDANREEYRQLFSAVFSDFYLFDRLLGSVNPGLDAAAADYLARLELTAKVTVQGGRFSTLALSQGQRKRLALLCAFLENRDIYLFDEWAADQDPEFKKIFYLGLIPDLKKLGKTVVVITHDDRYFACCDRIIKLESGHSTSYAAAATSV